MKEGIWSAHLVKVDYCFQLRLHLRSATLGAALGGMFFSLWLRLVFHIRLALEEEPRMKQRLHVLPFMMPKLMIVSGMLIKLK